MSYRAYRVEKPEEGDAVGSVVELSEESLPDDDVTVRVAYSSLNYKDALSARGRPGVTRNYPHTPGIDAAGTVVASRDGNFEPGSRVIVTSYDLGMDTPGGFGELIRVPAAWVVPLPDGLSLRESMILGTAGLTAGLAVQALKGQGIEPDSGPVVVSGASGGVGSLAVAVLAHLGYEVVASSGKPEAHEWLTGLGASRTIDRAKLGEASGSPMLSAAYAGGIDAVGGDTLANILKSTAYGGAVAACGLVQSPELHVTVFPFILRGVSLLGIDSAKCSMQRRLQVWRNLATDWKPQRLDEIAREVDLTRLDEAIDEILASGVKGRVLVRTSGE